MRAQNEAPPVVVRHVRGQTPDGAETDIPGAYRVERARRASAFARGEVWPQSRGSQLAGLCVGSQPGERDARPLRRAGREGDDARRRGGRGRGERGACRASSWRTCAGSARRNVRVVHADGRALPAELTGFDRALVDAPCSGLGVLAARPDLRWRSQPLPELQLELLLAAAERVRPGGTIVYSVCTINADESEAVVDASGLAVGADRGVAAVPPSAPPRVPADLPAPRRHERLLHRPA